MRTLSTNHRGVRRGFTLVEVCIGSTVLALFLGAIGAVMLSARGVYEQGLSSAALDAQARRTVQRVATELTGAVRGSLPVPLPEAPMGASAITFTTCTGFAGGGMLESTPTRIELRPDPRDAPDGADNDNDGFTDEQQVVLVRNAGMGDQTEAVICGNVRRFLQGEVDNMADDNGNGLIDEQGLSFELTGTSTLTIRLTLEGRDGRGLLVARTVETSVHMRN